MAAQSVFVFSRMELSAFTRLDSKQALSASVCAGLGVTTAPSVHALRPAGNDTVSPMNAGSSRQSLHIHGMYRPAIPMRNSEVLKGLGPIWSNCSWGIF